MPGSKFGNQPVRLAFFRRTPGGAWALPMKQPMTTAILMLLSAMGGAALAVFAMAAFIVGGRSDDFPAARVDRKVPARKGGQAMRA